MLIGLIVSLQLPLAQNFLVIGAAGIVGALALACINHRLSASAQHADAAASVAPAPLVRGVAEAQS
ncbi:hypothetical protein D9M68_562990 [compost metagenome]